MNPANPPQVLSGEGTPSWCTPNCHRCTSSVATISGGDITGAVGIGDAAHHTAASRTGARAAMVYATPCSRRSAGVAISLAVASAYRSIFGGADLGARFARRLGIRRAAVLTVNVCAILVRGASIASAGPTRLTR